MPRRSAVFDFFDAFNKGYDTTNRVVQDFQLHDVGNAKPETSQGFTSADGDQLAAMANAKDEQGNPYYTISANEDGTYRVKNNFQVDGAQAGDTTIAPRRVTDFMGRRYDGDMSESQVTNARMRAMADVVGRTDPTRGLALRQQALQSERDDSRFQREQQEGDLRISGLRRADAQGQRAEEMQRLQDEVGQYTPDQLHGYAAKANVAPGSQIPLLYTGRTKAGYQFVTTDPQTGAPGKTLSLNEAQTRQLATAAKLLEAGYGSEGTTMMAGVSKDLNDLVSHLNNQAVQTTGSQNTAVHQGNQDATARVTAGAAATNAGSHRMLIDEQLKDIRGARDRREDMASLESEYSQLTPAEQEGAKGQGILRRVQILNTKNGGGLQLGRNGAGAGKVQDLTRAEEISLGNAQKELANLPPNAGVVEVSKVYQKYGLDPERFGVKDPVKQLVSRLGGAGAGGSTLTPFTAADLAAERKVDQLDGYQKQPKRGLLAGRGDYEYYNPATGDRLTPQEYMRLDELRAQRDDTMRTRGAQQ